jgi:glycosyltransferase involved in cell wall biosynthesis
VSIEKAVLLLGRRDEPTDGVADYCEKLQGAAAACGFSFEIATVPWAEKGWTAALAELRSAAAAWRDQWVFLQYTTLAWSSRGFPLRAPGVLNVLRKAGARPAVVFHDFRPSRGWGIVGRARAYCQLRVSKQVYARSSLAVFTVPAEQIAWLPPRHDRAVFIPVGSNFPAIDSAHSNSETPPSSVTTVAVFGITGGPRGSEEVADMAYALRELQSRGIRVRLMAIGRGTNDFEIELRHALAGTTVEIAVMGLMPAEEFVRALSGARVLLVVRGHVSSRRGTAIAAIVCGVPIVGYRGEETGFPVTEAGIRLVEIGDREGLVQGLAQVATDEDLYRELRQRSLRAAQKYFSWDAIASQFLQAMAARLEPRLELPTRSG